MGEPQASQSPAGGAAANTTAAAADDDAGGGTEGGGGSEKGGSARPSNGNVGTGPSPKSKPGKRGSNVANTMPTASHPALTGDAPPLAGVATGQLGPLAANCFSKFAVVGLSGVSWTVAVVGLCRVSLMVAWWGCQVRHGRLL
eukprot:scaffold135291_cov20-Tisochrysis_lutea.AAC.1